MESSQNKGRRILCFIFDIVIVFLVSFFIVKFAVKPIIGFKDSDYSIVKDNLLEDIQKMMDGVNVDSSVWKYDVEMYFRFYLIESLCYFITQFLIISIYFVIIPLFAKNKTLGRLITKLKLVGKDNEDITVESLLKRELLWTVLLYCFTYIFLGFLIVIISGIVCAITGKSLVDRISKTRLVDINYKEDNNVIEAKYEEVNYYNQKQEEYNNISDNYNNNINDNEKEESEDSDDEYKII